MKRLLLIIIFTQLSWSQEDSTDVVDQSVSIDSASVDSLSQAEPVVLPENMNPALDPSIPLTLDAGYKGFLWGSTPNDKIYTNFSLLGTIDSLSKHKSFVGRLGPDSATVHYFFADSGFWKVEIDFQLKHMTVDKHIQDFLRHEKNISEVYGPPSKIKQFRWYPASMDKDNAIVTHFSPKTSFKDIKAQPQYENQVHGYLWEPTGKLDINHKSRIVGLPGCCQH